MELELVEWSLEESGIVMLDGGNGEKVSGVGAG